jgi:hypothetical protein
MRIRFLGLLVLSSLVLRPSGWASETALWLNVGLGGSTIGSYSGSASFSFQIEKYLVSIRATANTETFGLFEGGDEFYDVGLLIGYVPVRSKTLISIAAGIARVSGFRYIGEPGFLFGSGKREDIEATIGIPIEIQLFQRLSNYGGIGAYIYANINKEESFAGITVCLQLGKFQ